jgi:uncharacterized membrane protein (DUF485 family)
MKTEATRDSVLNHPAFRPLNQRRRRFAWTIALLMTALYGGFILLIAFDPGVLGMRLDSGEPTTLGVPAGIGLIVLAFILTGIYVHKANTDFDAASARILEECEQ